MPSTKVNVAEVLDEIQLADLNPDTKDATIQKSLETLHETFISRAVLDVSEIGRDVQVGAGRERDRPGRSGRCWT